MKKVLAIILISTGLGMTGCGVSTEKPQPTVPTTQPSKPAPKAPEQPKVEQNKPGNPDVYKRISKLTDCDELQVEFDRNYENHNRNSDNGKLELAQINTAYMEAIYDRQEELKCFG